ncbi:MULTISPECIES: recombinase family protein [unclassified Streptomyces]|uniref:recombinase family protein n=1 Tax=unclassified Streptomyces TaxID=2593676 RepID=UPI0022AF6CB8|nr:MULTISPECIES: recombinase family protein [unclassified Streptomyces]MCZ4097333.1 recombinase family protein [Streptomyces sp. H39-C1]MCZ4120637.1 recombinase family protein [Streptomyces sp. H39-S7]
MPASSTWEIHPDLAAALAAGQTFEEWLGDRCPVCSYGRISRDLQRNGKKELGVTRQHELHCDPAAAEHGWAVVYRYTDNDITAADPDTTRPAFVQMIRDLRARQTEDGFPIKGIIAVEEERVVRLPEDYLRLYRSLTVDEEGCLYYTDKRQLVDVYAEVEQTRGLMSSSIGETEVRKIRRRSKRSTRDRASEGKYTGGVRRFGWLDKDAKLGRDLNEILDPYESAHLRKAIDMKLSGKGWNTIAVWLINEKISTVRGGKWASATVAAMLTNPAICGYRILNGELVLDPKTGEPVVGVWETIATPEEWRQICRMKWPNAKTDKRPPKAKKVARKHLSSGILRCGSPIKEEENAEATTESRTEAGTALESRTKVDRCLHGMVGRPPYGNHKWGNYVCNAAECRKVSRRMDKIDKIVSTIVIKTLEEQFSNIQPEHKDWHGKATLDRLIARRQVLKASYKSGRIDLDDYLDFKDDLDSQIKESEADRDKFIQEQAAKNFLAGFTEAHWERFDLAQKGLAIGTVLQAVIVHPIPKGRSRKAAFDPTLIEVVFKKAH